MPTFPKIRETWGTPLSINPVGSGRLFRIRMRTGHDGRGMESGLPLFRPKENGSQIWIADFDSSTGTGTTKHRLTNIATEADGELWSPEGKNILFKSDVDPECDGTLAEEAACNEQKLSQSREANFGAQIFTYLL